MRLLKPSANDELVDYLEHSRFGRHGYQNYSVLAPVDEQVRFSSFTSGTTLPEPNVSGVFLHIDQLTPTH